MTRTQRISLAFAIGLVFLAAAFLVSLVLQAKWATWIFGSLALLAAIIGTVSGLPRNG
jgi:hypothetical protein